MDAAACLQAGDLDGALAALTNQVRGDPGNANLRVFLFQLLAVRGTWDRAKTQLDTAVSMDAELGMIGKVYSDAIGREQERKDVFSGKSLPTIFGEPEAWMASLVEALRLQSQGEAKAAAALRNNAFEAAPTSTGTVNGEAFEWIADADSRLGPMLEAIVNGKYFWVPFIRIKRISIQAPTDLRDQVWMPAVVTWSHGGESGLFIPTRYPGSEAHADPLVRLARKTEWREVSPDSFEGDGQRLFATNAGDYPVMDIRAIELDPQPEPGGA